MSARIYKTLVDSSGNALTGQNVDVYAYGGSKIADMTDNGDGSYYADISTTQKIVIYVNGAAQAETNGIIAVADDITSFSGDLDDKADKVSGATNGNLAGLDTNGNLTDSGVAASGVLDSDHAQANGAGGTTSLSTNRVHHAQAIQLQDVAGNFDATELEGVISEIGDLIGDMSFTSTNFISDLETISAALRALDNKIMDAIYLAGGAAGAASTFIMQFSLTGAQTSAYFDAYGFPVPRGCYVSKMVITWSAASIAETAGIAVGIGSGVFGTIDNDEDALLYKVFTNAGNSFSYSAGQLIRPRVVATGSDSITNPRLTVEFTVKETPVETYSGGSGSFA